MFFWKNEGLTGPRRMRRLIQGLIVWPRSKYEDLGSNLFYGADPCESALEIALNIPVAVRTDNGLRGWQQRFQDFLASDPALLRQIQEERVRLASQYAAALASMYYEGVASVTAAGDLVVNLNDFLERGFNWSQVVAILPVVGGVVFLKYGERSFEVTEDVARALNTLDDSARQRYLKELSEAATDEDRSLTIRRILEASDRVCDAPAPTPFANIGELPAAQRAILGDVWRGTQPVTALPQTTRQQLAGLYRRVASENPAGSAQAAFNEARARYLLGEGSNPGPSVVEFAERTGIPIHRRGGRQ